jgi:hypothetical protein
LKKRASKVSPRARVSRASDPKGKVDAHNPREKEPKPLAAKTVDIETTAMNSQKMPKPHSSKPQTMPLSLEREREHRKPSAAPHLPYIAGPRASRATQAARFGFWAASIGKSCWQTAPCAAMRTPSGC